MVDFFSLKYDSCLTQVLRASGRKNFEKNAIYRRVSARMWYFCYSDPARLRFRRRSQFIVCV